MIFFPSCSLSRGFGPAFLLWCQFGEKTPPNIKFHHKVMNALGCESVTGEGTCKKQSFCHLLNPNKIWFAGLVGLLHTKHASQA